MRQDNLTIEQRRNLALLHRQLELDAVARVMGLATTLAGLAALFAAGWRALS